MNSTSSFTSDYPFSPEYRVCVYHPDTRAPLEFPLRVMLERIERAVKVPVAERWLPVLLAMADGLFMQEESIAIRLSRLATLAEQDPGETVADLAPVMADLLERRICERQTVEELYRLSRLDELNRPRVWELNGWWNRLYGPIATKSDKEEEEDLDLWEDTHPVLNVGKISLPPWVTPEREDLRQLLEKKLLSQYEPLYRLRLSWHR